MRNEKDSWHVDPDSCHKPFIFLCPALITMAERWRRTLNPLEHGARPSLQYLTLHRPHGRRTNLTVVAAETEHQGGPRAPSVPPDRSSSSDTIHSKPTSSSSPHSPPLKRLTSESDEETSSIKRARLSTASNTPKYPIPRRRARQQHLVPQSPSSPFLAIGAPHAGIHRYPTPRKPGAAWMHTPPWLVSPPSSSSTPLSSPLQSSSPPSTTAARSSRPPPLRPPLQSPSFQRTQFPILSASKPYQSPPTILVSPPENDISIILAKCAHPAHAIPVGPEWQFAFASSLLARDQMAFEKLTWHIDMTFAHFATSHMEHSHHHHADFDVATLAKHTARQLVALLTRAWKPTCTDDYTYSPPSFRLSSIAREWTDGKCMKNAPSHYVHSLWCQRLSAVLGADMTEKISEHISQTIWYTTVRDVRRPYTRPLLMAHFCAYVLTYLSRWEAHEVHNHTRLLPVKHLSSLSLKTRIRGFAQHQHESHLCTSTILRLVLQSTLQTKLTAIEVRTHTSKQSAGFLQVPDMPPSSSHTSGGSTWPKIPGLLADVEGPAVIDAARFVGELARLHVIATEETVNRWLQAIFLHDIPWIQVPMHELEAGCALLLLTGSRETGLEQDVLKMQACSLHDHPSVLQQDLKSSSSCRSVHEKCLCKLEELLHSHWVPCTSKSWLKVRGRMSQVEN